MPPTHVDQDPYRVLKLDRNCEDDDIRRAYKLLSLKLHPDKNRDESEEYQGQLAERLSAVRAANNLIGTPAKRKEFDLQWMATHTCRF